ncbi:MAG: hypothetical protein FXF54_01225 [Kosmotoga sp.]|nr:MAG: hypothetical protein FXF54_01225 [Kosmotoga sp.]
MCKEKRKYRKSHNIMLANSSWKVLEELKRVHSTSASKILEEALWHYIETKGYNSLYFKLMSDVKPCNNVESEELTEILDNMTEEDFKVVRSYEIQDCVH